MLDESEICAAGTAMLTIEHARGEATIAAHPKTIVTFDLASLDTLATLGVEVAGCPKGVKPDYLARFDTGSSAPVGELFQINEQSITEISPDLITVAGLWRPHFDRLAEMAPTIDMSLSPELYLQHAKRNIRTLAEICGKTGLSETLIDKLEVTIRKIQSRAESAGTALLLLTTAGNVNTFGHESRFGFLFRDFGLTAADPAIRNHMHGQPAPPEYIAQVDPDWIFVVDRDAAIGKHQSPATELLDNDTFRQTRAYRAGRVIYLDPVSTYLVGSGATALQAIADQILDCLERV